MNPLRILMPTLLLVACSAAPRATQIPGSDRSGDVVAYVGIMPAAVARARMVTDASSEHPALEGTVDSHHLVVALFDATSGARIERATVVATHTPPRSSPVQRTLFPMRTGEVVSFGGEFEISRGPGHVFEIEARRPGHPPVRFTFGYDNQH